MNNINSLHLPLHQKQRSVRIITASLTTLDTTGLAMIQQLDNVVVRCVAGELLSLLHPLDLWRTSTVELIHKLIAAGASPNTKLTLGNGHHTVLTAGLQQLNRESGRHADVYRKLVLMLLAAGAHPNTGTASLGVARSPLCHHLEPLTRCPDLAVTRALLAAGADPTACCTSRGRIAATNPACRLMRVVDGWMHAALLIEAGCFSSTPGLWDAGVGGKTMAAGMRRLAFESAGWNIRCRNSSVTQEYSTVSRRRLRHGHNTRALTKLVQAFAFATVLALAHNSVHNDAALLILNMVPLRQSVALRPRAKSGPLISATRVTRS